MSTSRLAIKKVSYRYPKLTKASSVIFFFSLLSLVLYWPLGDTSMPDPGWPLLYIEDHISLFYFQISLVAVSGLFLLFNGRTQLGGISIEEGKFILKFKSSLEQIELGEIEYILRTEEFIFLLQLPDQFLSIRVSEDQESSMVDSFLEAVSNQVKIRNAI